MQLLLTLERQGRLKALREKRKLPVSENSPDKRLKQEPSSRQNVKQEPKNIRLTGKRGGGVRGKLNNCSSNEVLHSQEDFIDLT